MGNVYLDNAATTALRQEVLEEMMKVLSTEFGNPSSSHSFGRSARALLERSRKSIAKALNCQASEIIFTSGATEANNWILAGAVRDLGVQRIITTRVEHHAVLHAVEHIGKEASVRIDFLDVDTAGRIDPSQLTRLLEEPIPTLVSLMHVNNETGVMLDLEAIGTLCRQYNAWFHSDTVQSVGKTELDLQALPVDFIVASAHKFHGPKGVGFAFVRKGPVLHSLFYGGEQEKGLRPGTESVHNIAGMAHALSLGLEHLDEERRYIRELKDYAWDRLSQRFPGTLRNGDDTFYNILNVTLPLPESKTPLLLFTLDMKGIAVSRGSACQSGSARPSHVLAEMLDDATLAKPSLRISFSHYNTRADIDTLVEALETV